MLDLAALKQIVELAMDREMMDLTPDDNLYTDLGMDSIGAVAMVVGIQRRYRIRIAEEDIPQLQTPRQIMSYVNQALEGLQCK